MKDYVDPSMKTKLQQILKDLNEKTWKMIKNQRGTGYPESQEELENDIEELEESIKNHQGRLEELKNEVTDK